MGATPRATALVFVAVIVLAGCREHSGPKPTVRERSWNFIGQVERSEFGKGYEIRPKTVTMSMNPELEFEHQTFTVGPETMFLTDGRVLHVAPRTPGANACVELLTAADKVAVTGFPPPYGLDDKQVRLAGPRSQECIVIGTAQNGTVQRFAVLPSEHGLADVGGLHSAIGDRFLTDSGYRFRMDPDVRVNCLSERLSPADLLDEDRYSKALVDPVSKTIVKLNCLYRA